MKQLMLAVALVTISVPAYAQLGGLGGTLKRAEQAKQAADELTITDEEERKIGDQVSQMLRTRFGVVQDPAVHKYVSLMGTALAKNSERPGLNWTFVVLDTDGVNAFASPGGIVHVTRGALGLAKNEAELAGVIGHEIGHIVRKHTVNAIKKSKAVQMGTSAASSRVAFLDQLGNRAYEMVIENKFDRGDELDADKVGIALAQKTGYAGGGLSEFLVRLDDRNKNNPERNGLFASHPETKERIDKAKLQGTANAAVLVEARYKTNVKYEAKPIAAITAAPDDKQKGLSTGSKPAVTQEKQSAQVQASGGARGIGADRDAKGGDNPALVKTTVSAAELDTFKKGIA